MQDRPLTPRIPCHDARTISRATCASRGRGDLVSAGSRQTRLLHCRSPPEHKKGGASTSVYSLALIRPSESSTPLKPGALPFCVRLCCCCCCSSAVKRSRSSRSLLSIAHGSRIASTPRMDARAWMGTQRAYNCGNDEKADLVHRSTAFCKDRHLN